MNKRNFIGPAIGLFILGTLTVLLAAIHTSAGRSVASRGFEQAGSLMEKFDGGTSAHKHETQAWNHWKSKRYEQSIAAYQAAIASGPTPSNRHGLSMAMARLQIPVRASNEVALEIARLREATNGLLPSRNRAAYQELGDVYTRLGEFNLATEAYLYARGAVRKADGHQRQLLDASVGTLVKAIDEALARKGPAKDVAALWVLRSEANALREAYLEAADDLIQANRASGTNTHAGAIQDYRALHEELSQRQRRQAKQS